MTMKKIAVTGATGFVGKRLMEYNQDKYHLQALLLREGDVKLLNLARVDAVVHLAGKAHQMTPIEDSVYFEVNYELTKNLAIRAKEQGVRQFVYISSTKVYGDNITEVLNETSICHPTDAYGASKLKAEQFLSTLQSPGFNIAIVRPPLVYGPGVKGNMIKLLELAAKKYPLPLGNIHNARSMVFVDNLIELINAIINKEAAGLFIAGDQQAVSTSELITLIRKSLGNNYTLFSIPSFIRATLKKIKPAFYKRLFGFFVVDNAGTNAQLDFHPPFSTAAGVEKMAGWYKNLLVKDK
jgi:nucleoside-diphosphate-sugar epimerase